ncbi:P2X purinoceptor 4-like isoform X2 [Gigantopelta aegis]|uniref:P2X purinoceptor 4-like isoform X2 n=1 Tax=Gigantopelta aegis TaxID=1735272 RepID=UPI001B8897DB|nr:P2X purinoceptor 4-like isoform X2 [Gigantopelta aegis]
MAPKLVRSAISVFFEYDTPRIVHIKSKKVGFVNRFLQACVIGYVIGYAIVWQKGYQSFEDVQSAITVKVKGVAFTNLTGVPPEGGPRIWDVADYVVPPQENNAFFVMTNMIITPQTQDICDEELGVKGAICTSDSQCHAGIALPGGSGVMNGSCIPSSENATLKTCAIYAWCPVERDKLPSKPVLLASGNFTVFIKNNIEFPRFAVKRRNILHFKDNKQLAKCRYSPTDPLNKFCPIFKLADIAKYAGQNYDNMTKWGAVVQILIHWDCDLDYDVEDCVPAYGFRRLDSEDYKVSKGFNFRFASHFLEKGVPKRTLTKAYGIRFIVSVQGRAGKFDIVPLMQNIGSGLALLSIATIICDIFVLYILKARSLFRDKKYLTVTGDDAYYEHLDDERNESPVQQPGIADTSSKNLNQDD